NGFDEHLRCPWTVIGSIPNPIALSRIGGFHQLERQALVDPVLNRVLDDGHHVAILHHLGVVRDIAVAGHHQRAAGLQHERYTWDDELSEQTVERFELTLNATALPWIDDRELPQVDNVASCDDIRLSEKHHHVAVGMGASL